MATIKLIRKYRILYLMLLSALASYAVFQYAPMYGVIVAFKDFWITKGITGSPWVGFKHFEMFLTDDKFWEVFRNTVIISLQRLVFAFPAPIILALLLNEVRMEKIKRTIQTIIYLPHFFSWVILSGILFSLLSDGGLVNLLIERMGGEKIYVLMDSNYFRPLLVLSTIWKEAGWGTIIYLAALASISPEMYEAAIVDGANRWKQMIYITLPSLIPTISILLILAVGGLMDGGFDQVFNLYNPTVYDVGDIIQTYVYRIGLAGGQISEGAALGLFLSLINFVLLFSVHKIMKRLTGSGLF